MTKDAVVQNVFKRPPFISRINLPSKRIPKDQQSIWNIIKNAIGKDLSRLTTPIVYNEPLSFIQRLAEYMENSHLLHEAALSANPIERLELVGAFAASTLSSTRLSKPFNPLLFETYELENEQMGFRFISEQVSHHPPISAFHSDAINGDFELYGTVSPKLRFWGRSIECNPHANFVVKLPKFNESYTWRAVNISIHNIILGEMYLSLNGCLNVHCRDTDRNFKLHYKENSINGPHFISGEVTKGKDIVRSVFGNFNTYIISCPPDEFTNNLSRLKEDFDRLANATSDNISIALTQNSKILWQRFQLPENSEEYYDFSFFDFMLNEKLCDSSKFPRTDSRFRPDVRSMEEGNFDLASNQKKFLEDKQRTAAKANSKKSPKWFKFGKSHVEWEFNGKYWDRNFEDCENIF